MIEIKKRTALSAKVSEQLDSYILKEFGGVSIVRATKWATPDWVVIFYFENEIASFYNIVERRITIDNRLFRVAGVNNVITVRKFRGNGLSTKMLKETEAFLFGYLNVEFGLLLCADDLVPFYNRLNWYKVNCNVFFHQPLEGRKIWTANTMLLGKQEDLLVPKEIDLNGLPW